MDNEQQIAIDILRQTLSESEDFDPEQDVYYPTPEEIEQGKKEIRAKKGEN